MRKIKLMTALAIPTIATASIAFTSCNSTKQEITIRFNCVEHGTIVAGAVATVTAGTTWKTVPKPQVTPDDGWSVDKWCVGDEMIELTDDYVFEKNIGVFITFKQSAFCTDSWETIINHINSGGIEELKSTYNEGNFIGFQREIKLNGSTYKVRVIGQNHDTLADGTGTATLTFELVDLMSAYAPWNDGSNESYLTSNLYKNLNSEDPVDWYLQPGTSTEKSQIFKKSCLTCLKADENGALGSALKKVKKQVATHSGSWSTSEYETYLFPLSYTELGQTASAYASKEGSVYTYWSKHTDNKDHIKCVAYSESAKEYWTLSPYTGNTNRNWFVTAYGTFNYGVTSINKAVSFAFCI